MIRLASSRNVISISVSLIVSLQAFAGSGQNSNELNRLLTIGVEAQSELQKRSDGLYRADGIAAVISEPNYKSSKINFLVKDFENN